MFDIKKKIIRILLHSQRRHSLLKENRISKILNNTPKYNIHSFGPKNKDKIFYIIQRAGGGGMFSNLNYVLHHLLISDKLGFVPVVDMENYKTFYNENININGTKNSWNYYFEPVSKYSLKEVYSSKQVIITDGKTRGN